MLFLSSQRDMFVLKWKSDPAIRYLSSFSTLLVIQIILWMRVFNLTFFFTGLTVLAALPHFGSYSSRSDG